MHSFPDKKHFIEALQNNRFDKMHQLLSTILKQPDIKEQDIKKLYNFYSLAVYYFFGDFILLHYRYLNDDFPDLTDNLTRYVNEIQDIYNKMVLFLEERLSARLHYALREENFRAVRNCSEKILNSRGVFSSLDQSDQEIQVKKLALAIAGLLTGKEYVEKKLLSKLPEKLKISSWQELFEITCHERWKNFYQSEEHHQKAPSKAYFSELIHVSRNYLPGPNELSEPNQEELDRFRNFLSYLFTPAFLHSSLREEFFFSLLEILVEFNARSLSAAVQVSGNEERFYYKLGLKARKVVNRSFKAISNVQRLQYFQDFCQKIKLKDPYFTQALEVIGLFRNEKTSVYLNRILPKLSEEKANIALLGLSRIPTDTNARRLYDKTKKLCSSKKKLAKNKKLARNYLLTYFKILALSQFPGNLRMKYFYKGWDLCRYFDTRERFDITLLVFKQFAQEFPLQEKKDLLVNLLEGLNIQANQSVSSEYTNTLTKNTRQLLDNNKQEIINILAKDTGEINLSPSLSLILLLDFITQNPVPELLPFCERIFNSIRTYFSQNLSIYNKPFYFDPDTGKKSELTQQISLKYLSETVEAVAGTDSDFFLKIVSTIKNLKQSNKTLEEEPVKTGEKDVSKQIPSGPLSDLEKKRQAFLERRKQRLSPKKKKDS